MRRFIVHELQSFKRQRVQPDVRPACQPPRAISRRAVARRCSTSTASSANGAAHLSAVHAWQDADRAEVMHVQRFRETTQDRLVRVGGDAVDDQLVARDAEGDRRTILEQS